MVPISIAVVSINISRSRSLNIELMLWGDHNTNGVLDVEFDKYAPWVAIVLEFTLQVSWFLEAIEGRMVGSLKTKKENFDYQIQGRCISLKYWIQDAHLGRQESPLEAVEGKIEELLNRSPAPARIMLLVAVDIWKDFWELQKKTLHRGVEVHIIHYGATKSGNLWMTLLTKFSTPLHMYSSLFLGGFLILCRI